jgi:hypothetical protein
MKVKYKVRPFGLKYKVFKKTTIYGERTSSYESEPDKTIKEEVFFGSLSDCESYIRLSKDGLFEDE